MESYPSGWNVENRQLTKTFEKKSFVDAVVFVNRIAKAAEEMNHHPDVEIFAYKKVKVKLFTHITDSITKKDVELAERIDKLA